MAALPSLRLEYKQRLVHIAQQVKENDIGSLVGDGRGVALADDNVPARTLVLQVWVRVQGLVNCRGCVFVQFLVHDQLMTQSYGLLNKVVRHVREPYLMLGNWLDNNLLFAVALFVTHFILSKFEFYYSKFESSSYLKTI